VIRGRDVSRLEGFSDAVFGFALTLLVVSLEVPENYGDLQHILVGFPAFAVTFTVICWVWYEHYLLFRRYDLEDGLSVLLNCVLLFIVVFYAYPMKFMFTRLVTGSLFGLGPGISAGLSEAEARQLMLVYSGGFTALFATFMLLHGNAWRLRGALDLDALAIFDARASVRRHGISVAIGTVSVLIAWLAPIRYLAYAGLFFFLMGPAHGAFGFVNGRARERLAKQLTPSSA
jgi:Endosomal/lysosomal potassium channel TMEM175